MKSLFWELFDTIFLVSVTVSNIVMSSKMRKLEKRMDDFEYEYEDVEE